MTKSQRSNKAMKENSESNGTLEKICKKIWTPKNILRGIGIILVLLLLGGIWLHGYGSAKNKSNAKIEELKAKITEMEENPVTLEPITPEIVRKVMSEKTDEISELITAEYAFTNADRFTDTKHIVLLPDAWTQKSFIQKWNGVIKAGIKLEKPEVAVKENVITITLPHAEILSYEIDNNSVEILDEKSGLFNPIKIDDKVKFDRESEFDMKNRAVKSGLLKKAENSAEKVISNLLTAAIKNSEEYTFKFEFVDK